MLCFIVYLIVEVDNDFEKVRVIYSWIVSNISYDYKVIEDNIRCINKNICDIFIWCKVICMGYVDLFKVMVELVEFEVVMVDGYSKGMVILKVDMNEFDYSWNVVKLEGNWYLLDVIWGSSLVLND